MRVSVRPTSPDFSIENPSVGDSAFPCGADSLLLPRVAGSTGILESIELLQTDVGVKGSDEETHAEGFDIIARLEGSATSKRAGSW